MFGLTPDDNAIDFSCKRDASFLRLSPLLVTQPLLLNILSSYLLKLQLPKLHIKLS